MDDIWQDMEKKEKNDSFEMHDSLSEETHHHVLFTVLIPREHNKSSFVGFLGGEWVCAHIDEFCPAYDFSPIILALNNTPLSSLFYDPNNCAYDAELNTTCTVPFNQCQFLYKNIQPALQKAVSDPGIAHRAHELNNIIYEHLWVQPPRTCGK